MNPAEELAHRLGGRRNGKGWRARCPAHTDKDPSLDITIGENGKPVFICRTGCEQDSVIAALTRMGFWREKREEPKPYSPPPIPRSRVQMASTDPPPHPKFGPVALRYDYYDAAGNLIGCICRWDTSAGKQIMPASFDGEKWTWAGFNKPRPLYRLPDVLAQPSRPVLVVEGEKTADAARHIISDHTAITWPHGSSAAALCDWSPLKGRDVVLWPDADDPGQKAMREIGAILREVDAARIRLVMLPEGLPKGWDLADAIPDTMDPDGLIDAARDLAAERVAAIGIKSGGDLMSQAFKPPKWAVPDLIPEGLSILAGKPKTGKSWMGLDYVICVAGGLHALGNIKCEQGTTLYLALEDTDRRLQARCRAVLQGTPMPAGFQYVTDWKRLGEGGEDDLRAWLSVNRATARLVLIDTFQKIRGTRKKDAGIYEDDYRAVALLKALADEFTVPIVIVHHTNKMGNDDPLLSVSGTAGITGSADTIMVIQREPNDQHAVLYVRGRDVNEQEIAIQFDNETGKWLKLGKADDWRISEERRAIVKLLMEEGSLHPKEIAHMLGKKGNTIHFLLHKMKKDGDVKQGKDGRYTL